MRGIKIGWISSDLANEIQSLYGIGNVENNLHNLKLDEISNYNLLRDDMLKLRLKNFLVKNFEKEYNFGREGIYGVTDITGIKFPVNPNLIEILKTNIDNLKGDTNIANFIQGVWYNDTIDTIFFIYNEEYLTLDSLRMRRITKELFMYTKVALKKCFDDIIVPELVLNLYINRKFN